MRRISTGVQGRPILGNFFTETNTFSTRETNQDIVLEPNGAGIISAESHLRIDGDHALIFRDSDNNNTITIESPAISSDYTLTLPVGIGAAGNALVVDGSGNLSFDNISVDISNQTADTNTYYPVITTTTSGGLTSVSVSSSKLSFQPSSGTLTADTFSGAFSGNLSGNASSADVADDLNTSNNYRVNSFGVGTNASGTTGEIRATNQITSFYSDIRLKTKISDIENALEKLCKIETLYYEPNDTAQEMGFTKETNIGVSAQSVEAVFPELVAPAPIDENYLTVRYEKLTAVIIQAIKELKREIGK